MEKVVVSGATSQIGPFLISQLLNAGYTVHAVTRSDAKKGGTSAQLQWHVLSDKNTISDVIDTVQPTIWINTGPLGLVTDWLQVHSSKNSLLRIIGTSSTGVVTKAKSKNDKEQKTIQALLENEKFIEQKCKNMDIAWTIFRPTLVYSDGRDKNISVIVALIKKFKFFPVWNQGKGLRQPIHAEDIATAITKSLNNKNTYGQIYTLSGANILTYKEMVEVLFKSVGQKPRVLNLPYFVLASALKTMSLIPRFRYLNTEMIARINDDLNFDHEKATKDFGFSPRKFIPENVKFN